MRNVFERGFHEKLLELEMQIRRAQQAPITSLDDVFALQAAIKEIGDRFRQVRQELRDWLVKQPLTRTISPHKLTPANRRAMLKWMNQRSEERKPSVTEMANSLEVSRETIYAWRKRLMMERAAEENPDS